MSDFFSNVPVWFIVVFVTIAVLALAKGIYYRSTIVQLDDGSLVLVSERRFGNNDSSVNEPLNPLNDPITNSNIPTAVAVTC